MGRAGSNIPECMNMPVFKCQKTYFYSPSLCILSALIVSNMTTDYLLVYCSVQEAGLEVVYNYVRAWIMCLSSSFMMSCYWMINLHTTAPWQTYLGSALLVSLHLHTYCLTPSDRHSPPLTHSYATATVRTLSKALSKVCLLNKRGNKRTGRKTCVVVVQ